jgi:hypothetical protein
MAKKISFSRQLAFTIGLAAAKNKHTRRLAMKGWLALMKRPQGRRAVAQVAKQRASHSRPLMIGVASLGVISAAGAAVFARSKHSTEPDSDA